MNTIKNPVQFAFDMVDRINDESVSVDVRLVDINAAIAQVTAEVDDPETACRIVSTMFHAIPGPLATLRAQRYMERVSVMTPYGKKFGAYLLGANHPVVKPYDRQELEQA